MIHFPDMPGVTKGLKVEICSADQIAGTPVQRREARLLEAAVRLMKRDLQKPQRYYNGPEDVGHLLAAIAAGAPNEEVAGAIFLDGGFRILAVETLSVGSRTSVILDHHRLTRLAFRLDATALVGFHSHPGSTWLQPSEQDIRHNHMMRSYFGALGISYHDDLIVAGQQVISLQKEAYLQTEAFLQAQISQPVPPESWVTRIVGRVRRAFAVLIGREQAQSDMTPDRRVELAAPSSRAVAASSRGKITASPH